jgi:uncharacterized protein
METSVSTRSNVQIIQQAFTDFSKGNIPAIIKLCTEDVVWGSFKVPGVSFSGQFFGKEGAQEHFSELAENVDFSVFEPREFIAQGDVVMVLGHQAGLVKTTGKRFDSDWCFYFKMNEGKLQRFFSFADSYDLYKNFNL